MSLEYIVAYSFIYAYENTFFNSLFKDSKNGGLILCDASISIIFVSYVIIKVKYWLYLSFNFA